MLRGGLEVGLLVRAVPKTRAPGGPSAEGWRQVGELFLALALSALIGMEREARRKSAGLRTHTLVGVGAALFVLVSKYGFGDVLQPGRVVLDPSRMAAQIVSGVGFLGAGLIFVRSGSAHGLTTAAAIWLTAAVGAAAGAGLDVLAAATTAIYLLVVVAFRQLERWRPEPAPLNGTVRARYVEGRGTLREVLEAANERGFSILKVSTETVAFRPWGALGAGRPGGGPTPPDRPPEEVGHSGMAVARVVEVTLEVRGEPQHARGGPRPVRGEPRLEELAVVLSEVDGVEGVATAAAGGDSAGWDGAGGD